MSRKAQATRPSRTKWATAAHVAGNLLLGVSLGLLSYYGITALVASRGQVDLGRSLDRLGSIAQAVPPVESVDDPWAGWDREDRAYWDALELGGVFGRLVIPAMDLDVVVVKGTERAHLMKGPGWIVETDLPGPTGNAGIAGHRTTYGAPFREIDVLAPGDEVVFFSPFRRYAYEVVETLIVRPNETHVVNSTREPMLTMTACHPPYSAAYRIVVRSRLADVERLADTDTEAEE